MANELRRDYLLDRWVIIAGNRGKRPSDFIKKIGEEPEKKCFFCPGNENTTPPEIARYPKKSKKWTIRCFPNKFPAVVDEEGEFTTGILESKPAYGFHEVIVESPQHDRSLPDLSIKNFTKLLELFKERIGKLHEKQGVEYVSLFKNHGKVSGASLTHTHSQLISLPFTPPLIKQEVEASKKYKKDHKTCIFCNIVKKESEGKRKIIDKDGMLAFTPYASRFPFEIWVTPKKHVKSLDEMDEKDMIGMAKTLKTVLTKLRKCLDDPSYNLMLHYSPKRDDLHLHWEITPRLSTWAGFELGSNIVINTMPPEDAASHLRKS